MNAFIPTFEAVAMLLVIGIIGFWMVSRKMVGECFFSVKCIRYFNGWEN